MTRRKFIQKLIKACSAIIVAPTLVFDKKAWGRLTKKAAPRKFVRAIRLKKYPGSLKPLRDIYKQSKWSG